MSEEVAQHMEFVRVARTKRLRFEQDERPGAGFGQEEVARVAVKKIRISSGNMNTSRKVGGVVGSQACDIPCPVCTIFYAELTALLFTG